MNIALFYDTETSGLPLFSEPSEDPRQPHITQLGALLVDLNSRKIISSVDVIIRPDGWTIADDVVEIHGLTTEHAQLVGVPEVLALNMLMTKGEEYTDAGQDYFEERCRERMLRKLTERSRKLGMQIVPVAQPA